MGPPIRRLRGVLAGLHATLGPAGLMIAALSILSFAFGLTVLARESNRPQQSLRDAVQPILSSWIRTVPVSYVGWTIVDVADAWRRAADPDQATRLAELQDALATLGTQLGTSQDRRAPLIEVVAMDLVAGDDPPLARWLQIDPALSGATRERDDIPILPAMGTTPALRLVVGYRVAPELDLAAGRLGDQYFRLVLSVLGLSLFPLLCLIYMVLQAGSLRDRAAREAAQEATLDLANRTCHELGNVAFVLQNERRNLNDHLDLIERFFTEYPDSLARAARRAGLDDAQLDRLHRALGRELGRRGLDPEVELRQDAVMARQLCRQVAVCSDYIALTVRELDGYLRRSARPVQAEPIEVRACFDDALTILGPRLESAHVAIERWEDEGEPARARADRRLLVHALVNLLKNAVEAATTTDRTPTIRLESRSNGHEVTITVADNGPGIAPGDVARLFEVGYSTKGAGRGRGLAIVRESIQAQGGWIEVESHPGDGTEFRIVLPAAPRSSIEGAA